MKYRPFYYCSANLVKPGRSSRHHPFPLRFGTACLVAYFWNEREAHALGPGVN